MASTADRLKAAVAAEKLKAADDTTEDASSGGGNDANVNLFKAAAALSLKDSASASSPKTGRAKLGTSKLKAAVAVARLKGATTQWGEASYLETIDLASLSNEKLKRHLSARGEVPEGSKKELLERLLNSLQEEKQKKIALAHEDEAKHKKIAGLEEQGAVYAVGKNNMGQLGLGDLEDRSSFTVVPATRGKHVQHVSVGGNMSIASTEKHEVYAWGGGGLGLMAFKRISKQNANFEEPKLIEGLIGEETVMTAIGSNHACAVSKEGDLFVWGKGQFGVLGTGDTKNQQAPKFLDNFDKTTVHVACGEKHTCIKTNQNELYAWGHRSNGRLGIGKHEDGSDNCTGAFLSMPFPLKVPTTEFIRFLSCGSEHTLACTSSTIYSWGTGDGGRLGHGSDFSDRWEPTEIVSMRGSHILDISAGTWHSACVVNVPPMKGAGWLYTWGSGFQGQLGLNKTCQASTPTLVSGLCSGQVSVSKIFCGAYHNAAITSDGNLYTWGSNKHGALGRTIGEQNTTFTPHPGVVIEFGTIVNRIGRGLPRSVACGREYTIVATHPYDGPTEQEAIQIIETKRLRDEAERERQEALLRAREQELKRVKQMEMERKKIRYLTSKRLCTMDPKCPGFTYEAHKPSVCRECGFSVAYHTIVRDEPSAEDNSNGDS